MMWPDPCLRITGIAALVTVDDTEQVCFDLARGCLQETCVLDLDPISP